MDTARDRNPDAACVMSNELGNRNVKAQLHYIHGSVMMLLFTLQYNAYVRKTKGGTLVSLLSLYVGSWDTRFSVAR